MPVVVSLTDVRPAPRFDAVPWVNAIIEEDVLSNGEWVDIDEQALVPVDPNPATPQARDFTVTTATSPYSLFRVRFVDAAFNVSFTEAIGLSGYPTTEELVALSSVTELTSLTADQQDTLRDASIATIEEFCGQSFSYGHETVSLDGQGANVIYLPRRLESITALTINRVVFDHTIASISQQKDRLNFSTSYGLNYYEQALYEVSGERFPTGFGNVVISGYWGWLIFPEAVRTAMLWDMEDTARADANVLAPTIGSFRKLGLRSIQQGNLHADLGGVSGLSPRVLSALAPYVWHGQMGAVV